MLGTKPALGCRELEAEGGVVDDDQAWRRGDFAVAEILVALDDGGWARRGARADIHGRLERELDVFGGQWRAVAPLEALAQEEGHRLAVGRGLPAFGQSRLERPVVGDGEQLVEEQERNLLGDELQGVEAGRLDLDGDVRVAAPAAGRLGHRGRGRGHAGRGRRGADGCRGGAAVGAVGRWLGRLAQARRSGAARPLAPRARRSYMPRAGRPPSPGRRTSETGGESSEPSRAPPGVEFPSLYYGRVKARGTMRSPPEGGPGSVKRIPRLYSTLAAVALFASACGPSAPVAAPTQAAAVAATAVPAAATAVSGAVSTAATLAPTTVAAAAKRPRLPWP